MESESKRTDEAQVQAKLVKDDELSQATGGGILQHRVICSKCGRPFDDLYSLEIHSGVCQGKKALR